MRDLCYSMALEDARQLQLRGREVYIKLDAEVVVDVSSDFDSGNV